MRKPVKRWALWNYDNLFGVFALRRDALNYGREITIGGAQKFAEYYRKGAWTVSKVIITEARR